MTSTSHQFIMFCFSSPTGELKTVFGLLSYEPTQGSFSSSGWETHYIFRGQAATVIIASQEVHSRGFCLALATALVDGSFSQRIKQLDL